MLDKVIKVTTTKNPQNNQLLKIKEIQEKLNLSYVERKNYSIADLIEKYNCDYLFVVKRDKLVLADINTELFWHPNMALLKIKAMQKGESDPIIKAMDLKKGDSVLDCTLGFAADSLVVSSYLGDRGTIIGTEFNKFIAYLTAEGLKNYNTDDLEIKSAMQRIKIINADYRDYLKSLEDKSFDIVYFDPMFKVPNKKSAFMNSLRPFAEHSYLTSEIINEALRVARKRVVAKDRMFSKELEKLGFIEFYGGGARGSTKYGAIIKTI